MKFELVTWNPMPILDQGTWQALCKLYVSKRTRQKEFFHIELTVVSRISWLLRLGRISSITYSVRSYYRRNSLYLHQSLVLQQL
jgi:hypothetical protein